MNLFITLIAYFISFISIQVSDVDAYNEMTTSPFQITYYAPTSGNYLDAEIFLTNLPTGAKPIVSVNYLKGQYFDWGRSRTVDQYRSMKSIRVYEQLRFVHRIYIDVKLETETGLCSQHRIFEGQNETTSYDGFGVNKTICFKEACIIEVDFKNKCNDSNTSINVRSDKWINTTTAVYSAPHTSDIIDINDFGENEKSFPVRFSYDLGLDFIMGIYVSGIYTGTKVIYVKFQIDTLGNIIRTNSFTDIHNLYFTERPLKYHRLSVIVDLKTDAGICRQRIMEGWNAAVYSDNKNDTPHNICIGRECNIDVNYRQKGFYDSYTRCRYQEAPFKIINGTNCYGNDC